MSYLLDYTRRNFTTSTCLDAQDLITILYYYNNNNNNNNNKGVCILIDVAILGDRTVIKKEAENILKYEDLIIEIQRMWDGKAKIRGDWNHLKSTQTIPEQHTGKGQN